VEGTKRVQVAHEGEKLDITKQQYELYPRQQQPQTLSNLALTAVIPHHHQLRPGQQLALIETNHIQAPYHQAINFKRQLVDVEIFSGDF
jgi:hypothetical protein